MEEKRSNEVDGFTSKPPSGTDSGPWSTPVESHAPSSPSTTSALGNELERPLRLVCVRKGTRSMRKRTRSATPFTAEQRLLILDTWQRSGLPATQFAGLVGVATHTLYAWRKRFAEEGPAGLMDRPRGVRKGSRLPEVTKRTILMLKEANPEYGCQRISDMLARGPALQASPGAVATVLKEAGYESTQVQTRPHRPHVRRFERSRPGQLWMTDIFTFILKRQNRRVYMIAFLDDYSRFLVGYGLYGSATTALVLDVLRSAIASYGPPEEILTDNGPQYVTWRGKSKFSKELDKLGIKQIVARPKHPQTLGKIERCWGTLWRECLESAVFLDLEDARRRVAYFWDHYNFSRTHQGIGGLVPADRFFNAAPEVLKGMKKRVAANALELARHGMPKETFYVTGQVAGKSFSVHAEGERVILTKEGEERKEVELVGPEDGQKSAGEEAAPPEPLTSGGTLAELFEENHEQPRPPGVSPLDEGLRELARSLSDTPDPPDTSDDPSDGGES